VDTRDETKPLAAGPRERSTDGHDDATAPALAPPPASEPLDDADSPKRPRHRALVAAGAVVAVGFVAGSAIAFSGGGGQTTERRLTRPEASIVSTAPTTATTGTARATTTSPPVAAVAVPTEQPVAGTIEIVPTTIAPSTTTPDTTPTPEDAVEAEIP